MSGSGILEQAIMLEKTSKNEATHFAVCNGDIVRYLIAVDGGKKRLAANISTYSNRLGVLMKFLNCTPLSVIELSRIGYYVKARLHEDIQKMYEKTGAAAWNGIVGTYDVKQKIVLQCFGEETASAQFIKIGNSASSRELMAEIHFLKDHPGYQGFDMPQIIDYRFADEECPFNMQVTEEFAGERVEPRLNEEIYRLYKEVVGEPVEIDGVLCGFSHGDFTPWNIKKRGERYTIYDWEYCGMRFVGYDLIHYTYMIERNLKQVSARKAVQRAVDKARQMDSSLKKVDRQQLCDWYLAEVQRTLGHD